MIELIMVIVILGVLAAVALPKFVNMSSDARAASIQQLAGSVQTSMSTMDALIGLRGIGSAGAQVNITWIALDAGTQMRVWSGYPDRWCDGIGLALSGATVPSGGCYLSSAAVPNGQFMFYGYGNGSIPNGLAGWRIESAPNPQQCSVAYDYAGTTPPVVTAYTSGC
jgi:MSHA pilin protein MshA